ncbi:hypothetical protein DVK03_12950 [Haloferax sp. Atlit-109R]|nr:hypothetical protein C5B88_12940 [Haloferax sp. Atlit-24N]RLM35714.1 hypothetical protein DVK03_12950 [Haloferax sp. Atlit-109R]RLM43563.1 hypothetical protein DVK04_12950 [Haloferax sp. Atlit-105R]
MGAGRYASLIRMHTSTTQRVGSIVKRTEQGHGLVVVTEWRAATDTSLTALALFDQDRRRFWRCTECGQEHASRTAFESACITDRSADTTLD